MINVPPAQLACSLFYVDGAPLKMPYSSMRHLWPIYNLPASSLLLKFGRQTHKSTTCSQKMALPCVRYDNYHVLYTAPTGNQVSVFSTDKLNSTLRGSPFIRDNYLNTQTKDQVFYKELSNESKIYLRSAFHSADSARGITADCVCIDELQDILSDHVPVLQQTMSHSLAKWEEMSKRIPNLPMHLFNHKIYAGTPKTVENTLERYWANSTQNEWIIKCLHCNKYNYINEYNVGDTCLICNKCGKPIFYENGQWITMRPEGFIHGYRLPQIVLNWINNRNNPQAWQINVIETRKSYSSEKFYNEVLALPYANAKNPLGPEDIHRVCKDYKMVDEPSNSPMVTQAEFLTAGIDWGHGDTASGTSFTTLAIGAYIQNRFKLIFMKRYIGRMSDALLQLDDIYNLVVRYNVQYTMADWGDGRTSNAVLVKKLSPDNFAEVYEHGTQAKKIKFDPAKGTYVINRTQVMTDLFMEIKENRIDFFNYEQFEPFRVDFLNIYSEYSEQTRMTRYDHVGADDAFHSYMFCRLASMLKSGELDKYIRGGENNSLMDEPTAIAYDG
jgi:hypothetical protein